MVKVYGPAMSIDASGTLAKTITFSKWKGRNYLRSRVIPSNPQSGAQTGRRGMFAFLSQAWNALSVADKATWQDHADELVASCFNAYVSDNMKRWHNFRGPTQAFPATETGTPSDNAITGAAWEENRIALAVSGSALGDAWAFAVFASLTGTFTPAVGNGIIVALDSTIASHMIYWTPPSVATWYFNSIAMSDDGIKATAGGEQSAIP